MSKLRALWRRFRAKLTPISIILTLSGMVGTAVLTGIAQPALSWFTETASSVRDDLICGGRIAEAEGDRLSGLAERALAAKEVTKAQALFRDANSQYEKAYKCGFPDSGNASAMPAKGICIAG